MIRNVSIFCFGIVTGIFATSIYSNFHAPKQVQNPNSYILNFKNSDLPIFINRQIPAIDSSCAISFKNGKNSGESLPFNSLNFDEGHWVALYMKFDPDRQPHQPGVEFPYLECYELRDSSEMKKFFSGLSVKNTTGGMVTATERLLLIKDGATIFHEEIFLVGLGGFETEGGWRPIMNGNGLKTFLSKFTKCQQPIIKVFS